MIRAHVNENGIVIRIDSLAENLSPEAWEALLDELKAHHVPSFHQNGKRMYIEASLQGTLKAVIHFTSETVSMEEAVAILRRRGIKVFDIREHRSDR
jgi:hypothetical protein